MGVPQPLGRIVAGVVGLAMLYVLPQRQFLRLIMLNPSQRTMSLEPVMADK